MALTIYKKSSYVNWRNSGVATYNGGGSGSEIFNPPVNLSNYYTKVNLQTEGQSQVNWENIIGIEFINSIIEAAGQVQLVNDSSAPGPGMLYGTDEYGVKGWFAQPEAGAGGEVGITGVPVAGQLAIWTSEDHIGGDGGLTYDGSTLEISGDVIISGGIATGDDFALSSDERVKRNIRSLDPLPLDVEYKQFEMRSRPGHARFGVVAQDIMERYPELVRKGNDGVMSVRYFDLLIREIAYLKNKVAELELKVNG
jgi:hypothetical protein